MNKLLLITFILCMPLFMRAQIHETFSTDSFFKSHWFGDTSFFINASQQLQSKGTIGGELAIVTQNSLLVNTEWNCWIKNAFSPSTQNFTRFYLMSDSSNLKGALNGYYIQFGGSTGNLDSIALWKQKGISKTCLIGGRSATFNKSNNIVRIKVIRDTNGNWQLWSDTTGSTNYILEGIALDDEIKSSKYLGYYAKLTSGNASNVFLDDVYAGPIIYDTISPIIDSAIIVSDSTIQLNFSEEVDTNLALSINNYSVDNGLGFPIHIQMVGYDFRKVLLQFQRKLINKNRYNISVTSLIDKYGNQSSDLQTELLYYLPQKYDVLISEFLADPAPANDLPEHEFIELYNNTSIPINLLGWKLSDGSTTTIFPETILFPQQYLIVCNQLYKDEFTFYGNTLGLITFPSLNNAGDKIILLDNSNQVIHEVNYSYNWYKDLVKSGGGWTIELINPKSICKGQFNYTSSVDSFGGTPGKINSVWSNVLDKNPPQLIELVSIDSTLLFAVFDEPLDSIKSMFANIEINEPQRKIDVYFHNANFDSLYVLHAPFETNHRYEIKINGISDCLQNTNLNLNRIVNYYVPENANYSDIVINEIMANPKSGKGLPEVEYIEIHNTSNKVISVKDWKLSDNTSIATIPNYLLLPDSFLLLVPASSIGLFDHIENKMGLKSFPSLGNDADDLYLLDSKERMIHSVTYSKLMYHSAIKQLGGFSLELIDAKSACVQENNWTASSSPNGGTPGLVNSVNGMLKIFQSTQLIHVYPTLKNEIQLNFNTNISEPFATNIEIAPSIQIDTIILPANNKQLLMVKLKDSINNGTVYSLKLDNQFNCVNQLIETQTALFGWPSNPENPHVAINELLFHPKPEGVDFVEIINVSDSIYDFKNMAIANQDSHDSISNYHEIYPKGRLLMPHQYIVLTESSEITKSQFQVRSPNQIIETNMPNFNITEGSCILLNTKSLLEIDRFDYNENMHHQLLNDKAGVSIERIDYLRPSDDLTNWTSSSSKYGYATPTFQNSQFLNSQTAITQFVIYPEKVSPDGDGYEDIINLSYHLNAPNYIGNIELYNDHGNLIKTLMHGQLVGTEGTISWDGIDDKGIKAPIGIYIAFFQFFDNKGTVISEKKTLVVAGKL